MAPRRRRKVLPLQRLAFPLTALFVVVIGLGALWLVVWQAWPNTARRWMAKVAGARSPITRSLDDEKPRHPMPEPLSPEAIVKLRRENDVLREDNKRLRELLRQTSETLAAKSAQLEEMKLRRLILDKTRGKD